MSLSLLLTFATLAAVEAVPIFREIPPEQSSVTWIHHNSFSPNHYLPESTGPGVAGLTADFYGQGVAVGDYDGEGYEDVFITDYDNLRAVSQQWQRYLHRCDRQQRIKPTQWGSSALWFDYDNDGKLDLFVGEFVDYSSLRVCSASESYGGESPSTQSAYYCTPKIFQPTPSELYRNLGNGKFADVSATTGISSKPGKAWGVVATDVNNDGFMDLFVSNDIVPTISG